MPSPSSWLGLTTFSVRYPPSSPSPSLVLRPRLVPLVPGLLKSDGRIMRFPDWSTANPDSPPISLLRSAPEEGPDPHRASTANPRSPPTFRCALYNNQFVSLRDISARAHPRQQKCMKQLPYTVYWAGVSTLYNFQNWVFIKADMHLYEGQLTLGVISNEVSQSIMKNRDPWHLINNLHTSVDLVWTGPIKHFILIYFK